MRKGLRESLPGWLLSALAEVLLIFVGITLAIAFENWNVDRARRVEEAGILKEVRANLTQNVAELETSVAGDSLLLAHLRAIQDHILRRQPYSEDLRPSLARVANWASPYLATSAYETLKDRGLDLVEDPELRVALVQLFERDHALLVSDHDREEWLNHELSTFPLTIRISAALPPELGSDDSAVTEILTDPTFRAAIDFSAGLRGNGIDLKRQTIGGSNHVMALIDAYLGR
jgi:hypothetical protein